MLRILIVTQYFQPEIFRINDFAEWANLEGHEVTVLTGTPNYPTGRYYEGYGIFKRWRENLNGIDVVRAPQVPRFSGNSINLVINYLSFAFSASVIGMIFCRKKYDVIFVHEPSPVTVGLPAILLKWLRGSPIAFWVLDLWPDSLSATGAIKNKYLLDSVSVLVRFIYKHCDLMLVQSEGFIPNLLEHGVDRTQVKYLPSWAEEHYGAKGDSRKIQEELALPEGFYVLFTGNIGVAQDFPGILKAAELTREIDDIHWLIVGQGRMLSWVKDEAEKRGLAGHFHLVGSFPLERMPDFLEFADVTLVTLRREPAFSNTIPGKLQSYMASGKPVIGMLDGEPSRVILESKGGLVCDAEDSKGLAEAVLNVYDMPAQERNSLGQNSRKYYKTNFDRGHLFGRLENWLLNLSQEPNGSRNDGE